MAVDTELVESLRRFGLNQYEARAYAALCTYGSQTVGELSEKAKTPRPRNYDILVSLQEKGFVSVQQGRPVRYSALPVQEAVKTLRKQKETSLIDEISAMEELAKGLSSKLKPAPAPSVVSDERVWSLKGRDTIYSRMGSMIANAKKNIVMASHAEGFKRKMKAHLKEFQKAKERGVRLHFVTTAGEGDGVELADKHDKFEPPSRMLLSDNEAMLFLTDSKTKPEEEMGLWLKSPHVVQTLKNALRGQ